MASEANFWVDKALFLRPRLLLVVLLFFINTLRAEDVLLNVNVKKPVALTSDKFLSYTLDPTVVLTGNALTENPERSVNMAKALAPAYVRIGGPRSNSYTFEKPHNHHQDPDFTFSEGDWIVVHRWAENAGLDILACIAPQHSESSGREPGWDSRNALDLISFSDHMGFNTSWQLGYECQTRCDVSGIDIARDVIRLRSMLDAFPRYSKSVVTGPDVVTYRTKHQQQYLQDYLDVAGTALSAITWHPDFASITLDSEGVSLHHDNLALDRDGLYRVVGRLISKKPLWLAESKPEQCKKQFLGALVWTRRLGNAAKLGAQVLMRQPMDSNLIQPTPDYWVSVLHKSLVGREVLDTKIATGNRTHVHFYCQCTKPSSKYDKGSLTIFGINLTPTKIVANLKGIKINTLHKYILMPGFDTENRMFSETVLLNNEPLNLLNERELPEIKPAISSNNKGVALKLPSGGIGFWVIPGLKIKSCGGLEEDTTDKMLLKKLTRRLAETDSNEDSLNDEGEEEVDIDQNSLAEDRRFSPISGKIKRRRKYRYSEEDDAERRYRKWEARQDFERLEKLLRRRDNRDDRKMLRGPTAYFGFDESGHETMNNESEAEEMRAKLKEYKNRLKEYESLQKGDTTLQSKISEVQNSDTIDSDKVLEALKLISKMENAIKIWEKNVEDNPIETIDANSSYDMSSGMGSSNKSGNPEDLFLDKLLNSQKIKRASIPSKIEDQLRAIYQMLAEEKARRQKNPEEVSEVVEEPKLDGPVEVTDETLTRARRDTDKKLSDEPLGLKKEGLLRKRTKNDDARERRMERRRKKEKEDRKDEPVISDPKTVVDSSENNFYGFPQRAPLEGFPEGDVYLKVGTSSEESGKDYDYVKDDDDEGQEKEIRTKVSKNVATRKSVPDHATWIEKENAERSYLPKEFFEDVKMGGPRVQRRSNMENYSDLWEAQSVGHVHTSQDQTFPGDQEGTISQIIEERRPDVHEDKKAKDTTVKKLISYYNRPGSYLDEGEDGTGYINGEFFEKPEDYSKDTSRTLVPSSAIKNQRAIHRNPAMLMNTKRAADLSPYKFTDYDSRHFERATETPVKHENQARYESVYPAGPASRAKRSSDNVERIMDQEMIFQDDDNLKDCDCRVQRGIGSSERQEDYKTRREGREERRRRLERLLNKDRKDEEKLRVHEGPLATKRRSRFNKDDMQTTRAKRHVGSISAELDEMIFDGEVPILEGSRSESEYMEHNEPFLAYVESRENAEALVGATIDPAAEQVRNWTVKEDNKRLTVDDEKANLALEDNTIIKEKKTNLALKHERLFGEETTTNVNFDLGLENEEQDSKDNIVKRHNAEHPSQQDDWTVSEKTGTPTGSQTVIAVLTKNSEVDPLFLAPQPDVEANSKTVRQTSETEPTRSNIGLSESLQNLQTSSSEIKQSAIGLRSIGTETEVQISSTATTDEDVRTQNNTTYQSNVDTSTVGSANLLGDPQILSLDNDGKEIVADKTTKVETEENGTKDTSESQVSSSSAKEVSELTKDGTRTPRKIPHITKPLSKVVDSIKRKKNRASGKWNTHNASRKAKGSRKPKKPSKTTTKMRSKEQAKRKAMKKMHANQLQELREKLRLKREKIVQEYQDELMSELEKAADDDERNLKRRDIMEMITNDKELRDIVDQAKLKYLMQANPVNYEEVRDDYRTEDLQQRKRYVPEMIEIIRPLHEVRERKVKVQSQRSRHSSDPKLLAYSAPEDSSNAEAIRKSLRETTNLSDHKIERRAGKRYHSIVESLENSTIHQYSSEEDCGEETSVQVGESAKLAESGVFSVEEEETEEEISPISNEEDKTEGEISPTSDQEDKTEGEISPMSDEEGKTEGEISPMSDEEDKTGGEISPMSDEEDKTEEEISPMANEEDKTKEVISPTSNEEDRTEERIQPIPNDKEKPEDEIPTISNNEETIEEETPPISNKDKKTKEKIPPIYSNEEKIEDETPPISNEDSRAQYEDIYDSYHSTGDVISQSEEKKCRSLKTSENKPRFARNVSGNKNQYKRLKANSGEGYTENKDELLQLVTENDHNKAKHVTKKKYLKDADYEQMSKYKSPVYARLVPDKVEAGRRPTLQIPSSNEDDYHRSQFEDIASRNSKTKTEDGRELRSTVQKKDEVEQLASEMEMIDDLDLDEALNSSKYELLMLIPVKNQKKIRQRRHVENELSRDEDNSASNVIEVDIIDLSSKNRDGDKVDKKIKITKKDDRRDSTQTAVPDDFVNNESVPKVSTVTIDENSSPSTKQDGIVLDELAIAEILQSVPQTVSEKISIGVHGLPGLIEEAIPKLGATLNDGLDKAHHISSSFEKFIDEFDDRFNQKEAELEAKHPESIEVIRMRDESPISSNIFSRTISSTRKFFDFLTGMVHAFRFN